MILFRTVIKGLVEGNVVDEGVVEEVVEELRWKSWGPLKNLL